MKLLICTQVVDKNHPILGFFHRWIEEFAKHCEEVHVICLLKGEYSFPENVFVYSLGKEEGENKFKYLVRFYSFIWKLRGRYDSVFVHMNQVYVILGALIWRLLQKKIGLWYMHRAVTLSLQVAEKLTDIIFTGSKESFRIPSKKVLVTGHGIDTEHFVPQESIKNIDLVTVGRISPSKNLLELVELLGEIQSKQKTSLTIIGEAITETDMAYKADLKRKVIESDLVNEVHFVGVMNQSELPHYLRRAKVFVHSARNGSLDKAILEAMAVGIPVVSSSEGAVSLPLGKRQVSGRKDFVETVQEVLQSGAQEQVNVLREYVLTHHSLSILVPKILKSYQ